MAKKPKQFRSSTYTTEAINKIKNMHRTTDTEVIEAAIHFLLKQPEHKVSAMFYEARKAAAEREVKELGKRINDFAEDV